MVNIIFETITCESYYPWIGRCANFCCFINEKNKHLLNTNKKKTISKLTYQISLNQNCQSTFNKDLNEDVLPILVIFYFLKERSQIGQQQKLSASKILYIKSNEWYNYWKKMVVKILYQFNPFLLSCLKCKLQTETWSSK